MVKQLGVCSCNSAGCQIITGQTSNIVTTFTVSYYSGVGVTTPLTNCSGTPSTITATLTTNASCVGEGASEYFNSDGYMTAVTLTRLPVVTQPSMVGQYKYTSADACQAGGTTTALSEISIKPAVCTNGETVYCSSSSVAIQGAVGGKGFQKLDFYRTSPCNATSQIKSIVQYNQLDVCEVKASSSAMVTGVTDKLGTRTVFTHSTYQTTDCSGKASNATVGGVEITPAYSNSSQACSSYPTGLYSQAMNIGYYTATLVPSVSSVSSALAGTAPTLTYVTYQSNAACSAGTANKLSTAQIDLAPFACSQAPLSIASAPAYSLSVAPSCSTTKPASTIAVYVVQQVSGPTITQTLVASAPFKQAFATAVTTFTAVARSAVNVTEAYADLAGAGTGVATIINIAYSATTITSGAAAVSAVLGTGSFATSMTWQLRAKYPGITVAVAAIAQPSASPVTAQPSASPVASPTVNREELVGGLVGAILGTGLLLGFILYRRLYSIHTERIVPRSRA